MGHMAAFPSLHGPLLGPAGPHPQRQVDDEQGQQQRRRGGELIVVVVHVDVVVVFFFPTFVSSFFVSLKRECKM
jgi:hypothetical protein